VEIYPLFVARKENHEIGKWSREGFDKIKICPHLVAEQ
jgi:hypothetical protein